MIFLFPVLIIIPYSILALSFNFTLTDNALVSSSIPDGNIADNKLGVFCSYYGMRSYVKYNFSDLDMAIKKATLWLFKEKRNNPVDLGFYHVKNDTWNFSMTWNTQPCGPDWNLSSNCDPTPSYIHQPDDALNIWESIDVTNLVKNEDDKIISLGLKMIGEDTSCGADKWVYYNINSFLEIEICTPEWIMNDAICQTDDTKFVYYTDANNCENSYDLPDNNGTYVYCDHCTPYWVAINTTCQPNNIKLEYFMDENDCYSKTGLQSDLEDRPDYKTYPCDYCKPEWKEVNTTCQPDDTMIGYFVDDENCYSQTHLESDLENKPQNNTYFCDYCESEWALNDTWGECQPGGIQFRNYYDIKNCSGTELPRIPENRTCNYTSSNNVDIEANQPYTVDRKNETNVSLEITTSEDITNGTVNITPYLENPTNASFSFLTLGKYVDISVSPEISEGLLWLLIKIYYTDEEVSESGIREESLRIHTFNGDTLTWEELNDSGVNTSLNYVWGNTTHPSFYGAFGEPKQYCGDEICNNNETCSSCPTDCGNCQTTTTISSGTGGGGGTRTTSTTYTSTTVLTTSITTTIFPASSGLVTICEERTTNCYHVCGKLCSSDYEYCVYYWNSNCAIESGTLQPGEEIPWLVCNYAGLCSLKGKPRLGMTIPTSSTTTTEKVEEETIGPTGAATKPTGKFVLSRNSGILVFIGLNILVILFLIKLGSMKRPVFSLKPRIQKIKDIEGLIQDLKKEREKPKNKKERKRYKKRKKKL